MKNLLLGSMVLAAVLAGPATTAAQTYNWSGVYVGGSIGGVWGTVDRSYPNLGLIGQSAAVYSSSGSDVIIGFHGGAQWQWGQLVLGIEAGYNKPLDGLQSTYLLPTFFTTDFYSHSQITDLFTIGPRLGYAWDRWMVFITGGYASGSIRGLYSNSAGVFIFPSLNGQSRNDGWFIGGGLEYMLLKGPLVDVLIGVEYQHFDLGEVTAFCFLGAACTAHQLDFNQRAQGDIIRARVTIKNNYSFLRP